MVLSVLERGEAHGFDVMRRLEREGCGALRLREGSLYPVLYRLERVGCIEGQWETDNTGRRGPRRRIYRLTNKGRRELAARRDGWRQFVAVVGPIVEGMT